MDGKEFNMRGVKLIEMCTWWKRCFFFLSTQTAGFILYYKTKQTNNKTNMVSALPAFTLSSTCLQVVMSQLDCIQGEIRPEVMCWMSEIIQAESWHTSWLSFTHLQKEKSTVEMLHVQRNDSKTSGLKDF